MSIAQKDEPDAVHGRPRRFWKQEALSGMVLLVVTLLSYQPVWNGEPLWDDQAHMTAPELRSLHGLARIWLQPGATQQYYPLTHSLFWLQQRLWGDAKTGYHLCTILLHVLCAFLFFKALQRLNVQGALLAALLFALHPVQVESVAWISELKNTLSGCLFLGAGMWYLSFNGRRKKGHYAISLFLFTVGLMAKSVIAILPVCLLAVLWWKRGRLSWKRDVIPLVPFFLIGMASGLFTAWIERRYIGAKGSEFDVTVIERCLIAGRAVWFYMSKLLVPIQLTFVYPRWHVSQAVWWQYLFPFAVLVLAGVLWAVRRSSRAPFAAFLFFIAALFPALGFFNVYPFRYSFVADHFLYLAAMGPIALAASGIASMPGMVHAKTRFLRPAIAGILLLGLAVLTWRQSSMYRNSEELFRTTIARNPGCWMAYSNLGTWLQERGRLGEAIENFKKALELKPDDAGFRNNLGQALQQERGWTNDEAVAQFQKAIELNPDNPVSYCNLGNVHSKNGRIDEAIGCYRTALKIEPDYLQALNNLGNALLHTGQTGEAVSHYRHALELDPENAVTRYNLGNALLQTGDVHQAIAHFRTALRITPGYTDAMNVLASVFLEIGRPDEAMTLSMKAVEINPGSAAAHYCLAGALLHTGQIAGAIGSYEKSLECDPRFVGALNNLALIFATCPVASLRNGTRAVALAERADSLTQGGDARIKQTLAAAYAEEGRFNDALSAAHKALALARSTGQEMVADQVRARLRFYERGEPGSYP
ncbi:MAG: tetratricopeptide repeat protein [Chitinispirillaceae bacterium]|nr:tetratricopeptide repeat protein [Chitinispirillaceae bacterium]